MEAMSEPVADPSPDDARVRGDEVDPSDHPPLGFIGLGQVGTPMARRLLGWPGDFVVCDVNHRATTPFSRHGARVRATPAEVAERTRIISIMVGNDDQVSEVITGHASILETARPGTIVAIHTAVSPETPIRLARIAAHKDVILLDAPVIGGVIGAMSGELAMMIGGPVDAVDAVRDAFSNMASLMVRTGPVGTGTYARLARSLITYASFVAVGEATELAARGGVDLKALGDAVRHSEKLTGGPGAILLRRDGGPLSVDDDLRVPFERTRRMGERELAAVRELAERMGLDLPLADMANDRLATALGLPSV